MKLLYIYIYIYSQRHRKQTIELILDVEIYYPQGLQSTITPFKTIEIEAKIERINKQKKKKKKKKMEIKIDTWMLKLEKA